MSVLVERVNPESLPDDGPFVVVVDLREGVPLASQYVEAARHPPTAGGSAAALLRTPPLSSRDELEVGDVERGEDDLVVRVRIRAFTGALFANVMTVALAAVGLPELEPGRHTLRVEERVEPFDPEDQDQDEDEPDAEPSIRSREVSFRIAGEDGP